jgi:hypothetical protein
MRRAPVFLAALASLVAATSATPGAQCAVFSKAVSCAQPAKPPMRLDFGATTPLLRAGPVTGAHMWPAPTNIPSSAVDCAMVQQPDPKFHSAMPIVRPSAGEGATFAMNIVRVPSCKTK